MTQMIDRLPVANDIGAPLWRASLFQLLQAALRRPRRQAPPLRLYADLGLPPSERPDFTPHSR